MGMSHQGRLGGGWWARLASLGFRRVPDHPDPADLGTDAALDLCLGRGSAVGPFSPPAPLGSHLPLRQSPDPF